MNNARIIAQKELKDILRNRIFSLTLILLIVLTLVSLVVSEAVFKDQVVQYERALTLLESIGKMPNALAPQLYPLNLLRGIVDYVEIVGAILGIFLGYISVTREKTTKAIKLILSRPVSKYEIIFGKLLGNFIFVCGLMTLLTMVIGVSLSLFGGAVLGKVEVIKLTLFVVLSAFYILIFFSIAFFFSLLVKTPTNALIISFAIWLMFALIFPQIGDTMDPDNQVPGGFFKRMALTKEQELRVLGNFAHYEKIRTGIEQVSITKHYERAVFGLFGIKKQYNGASFSTIFKDKWGNMLMVLAFLILGVLANLVFIRKSRRFFE